ncbi:MAG: hypothetical protein SVW77_02410 [Candidatus Nanohaloarchaea archaeon]|nr:hypothetical protein [Candidatus Nanohaloarchaea archaeon]
MPSIPNTLADTRFNLSPGESRTVHTVEVPLEGQEVEEDRYIDTYTVQVSTAAVQEELSGLEAGAESIVGRDDAASYRWRVTGGRHQIAAVLDPDGITMEVSSTP